MCTQSSLTNKALLIKYFEVLKHYDEELQGLTENIWKNEYLGVQWLLD